MIHSHVHTEYSFLDGVGTSLMLAEKAAEMGQPALCLTDHGVLCGALHHLSACEKHGIIPILGMEAYYNPDRTARGKEHLPNIWHLILLAKNETGWKNLVRISSESHSTGFYRKPRVDDDLLSRYGEGLIASASCLAGYIPNKILTGEYDEANRHLEMMLHLFGDDFFFEIQPHNIDAQREYNIEAVNLAAEHGVPVLATADVHYPYEDWDDTHDVLLLINTRTKRSEREEGEAQGEEFMRFVGNTYWLMDDMTVMTSFEKHHPSLPKYVITEAISNTEEWLLSKIDPFTISKEPKIPKVTKSEDEAEAKLRSWIAEGLERVAKEDDQQYLDRVEYELDAMREAQFFDLIIIIGEMVRFAKREGIRKGPGRGSAAGSLVCYLIGVTDVDPIGHLLPFERFLAPGRKEPPDVDLDFQHDRRDEIKMFVADLVGHERVAELCAFGTFALKNTLQFVGRVIEVPYAAIEHATKTFDALAKGDDADVEMSLEHMRKLSSKLDWLANKFPELWRHSVRLQGQCKQLGTHAAGLVVTDQPINEVVPTMRRGEDGTMVTAWSDGGRFRAISEYGFIKIDVLSTDALTKQNMALRLIRERTGEDIDLNDPSVFPSADPGMFDPEVIALFAEGKTLGIFQFHTPAMVEFLRELAPETFIDLVAANALFRPGPLEGGEASEYGRRKGQEWSYPHPILERILKPTRGVLAFQETVMQIAVEIGGFTGAEADDLRKAMGKLYRLGQKVVNDFLRGNKYDQKFLTNAIANGLSPEEAHEWWNRILAFGSYGFAKNHSCPYSLQAYQDGWLKIHYPWAFWPAFLTFDPDRVRRAVDEMESLGLRILLPDINESDLYFTPVDEHTIRFGLLAVKGIKDASVAELLAKRPFTSLADFEERIEKKKCNKTAKAALYLSGALDSIGGRNGGFWHEIYPWAVLRPWTAAGRGKAEKETIQIALSNRNSAEEAHQHKLVEDRIWTREEFDKADKGEMLIVGGEVVSVKKIVTKRGDDMGFCSLRFREDDYELTLFPEYWSAYHEKLEEGELILAYGEKESRGLIVNTIGVVSEIEEELS